MNEEILNKIIDKFKNEVYLAVKNRKYCNINLSLNVKNGEIISDFHIDIKNSERIKY